MAYKKVQCFAHGTPGDWEAMCIDLDISVQGISMEEVQGLLNEAITTYVVDACAEDRKTTERLLNRRAPFGVRFGLAASFLLHAAFSRNERELKAGFELPCHA